jgi:hypothetical protein
VNAHFQNGKAEKKIRDLQDAARTSLLHSMRKWPQVITIHLWPYAMRYSNDVGNVTPNKHETLSPIEKFSDTQSKLQLRHFHHFGCPTYILDSNLQAGKRAGYKWKERARLGVNLGFSPQHARSVHLILSLTTGCVSPQFHCTFDDHFNTVSDYTYQSLWQEKAHLVSPQPEANTLPDALPIPLTEPSQQTTDDSIAIDNSLQLDFQPPPNELDSTTGHDTLQQQVTPSNGNVRRSSRARRPPAHFADYVPHEQIAFEALHQTLGSLPMEDTVMAMKSIHDPDTMYLWEAKKEKDYPQFLEAMQKEIDDHTKREHWKL